MGFKGTLLSCTSLPMAANGLSRLGFLGVCLYVPCFLLRIMDMSQCLYFKGRTEQRRGSHLLWVVYISVLKLVLHTQLKVLLLYHV